MEQRYIFSSESVNEGHPDKVCDMISDAVLDACLAQDPHSRVACETMVKDALVVLGGEITTKAKLDYEELVRGAIREIGYTDRSCQFQADRVMILNALGFQSPDIAQGVDARAAEHKEHEEQGAGDQGIMFGYACNETPELMPAPILYAHKLSEELTRLRKNGGPEFAWLRPDGKTQVSIEYVNDKPTRVVAVVVSTMHSDDISTADLRAQLKENLIEKVIPAELLTPETEYLINPTGRFVVGGPEGDAGLTGRKIIVDTYGGMGRHGGGAFSGKDPSKVDRSAAYYCRWVAKNVVAAGLADRCELQVAYAIGHPEPVSICVNTFGTQKISEEQIEKAVRETFNFKPAEIIKQLDLLRPIYRKTTNYGHFGREDADLPWEKLNRVEPLKKFLK